MKFYLMRHGEAELFAASDPVRQLTDRGVQHIRERITSLQPVLSEVDCIVHSPFVRTTQTAQIAAEILNLQRVSGSDLWVPGADPMVALEAIAEYVEATPLFITHMPLIAAVEAVCVGEQNYPAGFECSEISELIADWPAAGLATSKRI